VRGVIGGGSLRAGGLSGCFRYGRGEEEMLQTETMERALATSDRKRRTRRRGICSSEQKRKLGVRMAGWLLVVQLGGR